MTDFLSQMQQALSSSGPAKSINIVPPRPTPVLVVEVEIKKTVKVTVECDEDDLGTSILQDQLIVDGLMTADDTIDDYSIDEYANSEALDAWDEKYGEAYENDGTPIYDDEDEDESDDDEYDDHWSSSDDDDTH